MQIFKAKFTNLTLHNLKTPPSPQKKINILIIIQEFEKIDKNDAWQARRTFRERRNIFS